MPGVSMAQNDGCNLNHVPGFCDPGADGPGPDDNCGCDWLETFEDAAYADDIGTFIDRGDNWWYGWEDGDLNRGIISTAQNHTAGGSRSLLGKFEAIGGPTDPDIQTDATHWFLGRDTTPVGGDGDADDGGLALGDGAGYDVDVSDYWILEGYVLIPSDHTGESFVIVNSWYTRGDLFPPNASTQWHIEYHFDSTLNRLYDDLGAGTFLPLVKGEWVKIEAQINLDLNILVLYYDGQFLEARSWLLTGDTSEMLLIGNLDLFVSDGTDTFYDDFALTASEPPPINTPSFTCVRDERNDVTGCTEYVWTLTNRNLVGDIVEFYIDVAAGSGARHGPGTCVGAKASTDAIFGLPAGWSKTNCSIWKQGHALFKFVKTSGPGISPGASIQGRLKIDPNRSVLVTDKTATTGCPAGTCCNDGAGIDIPPYMVLVSAAQLDGNQIAATCPSPASSTAYSFGPCFSDPGPVGQKWSPITRCESFLNAPSTSTWAKVVLAVLLVAGGSMLVLRSRRVAA